MSLADYLAKNYLNADSKADKKSKKRKRKDASAAAAGLVIEEDDTTGWSGSANPNDAEDGPLTVDTHSAEFRKAKSSNWKTLTGAPATLAPSNLAGDDAAADAIVASAAAENRARAEDDDEAPALDDSAIPLMESGARAGLVTAAQLAAQLKKAQMRAGDDEDPAARAKAQETIYRDASGRIINVAMKRAELRAQADADEAKKAAEREDQKGDVQKAEAARRKEALKDAKFLTVARYADDEDLNAELKERERWNDPAMQFMEKKKAGKSSTGKPLYKGAAPPNRYGIRPGHRWDGVDRSNGFEKEYFAAQNRRKNVRDLEYAWQMDE